MSNAERVQNLLAAASELSPDERAAFLDAACRGDLALRAEVESLVRSLDDAGGFLAAPTADSSAVTRDTRVTAEIPVREQIGTRIGPYKLLQQIGEGGFGSVFMAQQESPVVRKVALKIIKLGMDTRQVVARFEQERQALAMMDHASIARVFDAGATETGRPYFVMELVKGDPIVEYCDKNNLSIGERLELFAQVCTAVQHAHTKGIIHRDIKPSNILVSMQDGRPCAKVIDFGIAKATNAQLTEKTLFTEHRQLIGTPEYMSPEQAEGSLDIDTRTDVYSLGVLLYELLTGSTPFSSKQLRSAAYAEIQRIIREVEPPRPSTRLNESSDTIASVAAKRHTEPRRLGMIVRGELDWIVMKAMEKDRQRRYETANGLAMDVRRYLAGEAVVAAPPGTAYRFRKFVRRNRGVVTTACVVGAALILGIAGTTWQAAAARDQRDLAIQAQKAEADQRRLAEAERTEAQAQRNVAQQEAARSKALSDFVEQMLLAADPDMMQGQRDVTVRELLTKASAKIDKTLKDQPMVEAAARTLLGSTLNSLGHSKEALVELRRAIALREGTPEARTFPHAETLHALGEAMTDIQDRQAALEAFLQAQEIVLGLGASRAKEAVIGYADLAVTYLRLSRFAEAEQALDKAEAILKERGLREPAARAYIASARSSLATEWRGDAAQAEALAEQEVALRREAGDPTMLTQSLNNLAVMKMGNGKLDEAEALYKETIEAGRREFGENNHRTAMWTENLANLYYRKKQYDLALQMLKQVIAIRESVYGADSMAAARTRLNMSSVALSTGDFRLALELADAVLPIFRKAMGEKSMDFTQVLRNRGAAYKGLGELESALREYQAALAIIDEVNQPAVPVRIRTLIAITEIHCLLGHADEAARVADLAFKVLDAGKPEHAKQIKTLRDQLAACQPAPHP